MRSLLLDEVHITVLLEELEIAYPVKIRLAHFQFRQLDDLGQIAFSVGPVECRGGGSPEGAGRISFSLIARDIVHGEGAHPLAANDDLLSLGIDTGSRRLYGSHMQLRGTLLHSAFNPRLLNTGVGRQLRQSVRKIGGLFY